MSIENAAITELDGEEVLEEVLSEQSQAGEESSEIANADESTEIEETDDTTELFEALSGEAEPEANDKPKTPRSTAKANRKARRLQKQLDASNAKIAEYERQKPIINQPVIPEQNWDAGETDAQYQYRVTQQAITDNQNAQQQTNQFEENRKAAIEHERAKTEHIDKYSDEVNKLNFKDYDEIESVVLDGMQEETLTEMSKVNAAATPKIMIYLYHNPDIHAEFKQASLNDAPKFYRMLGKLEGKVTDIESRVKNRKRSVSKAPADTSLNGGNTGNSLDDQMQKAANNKDFKLYRQLKAKKYKQ